MDRSMDQFLNDFHGVLTHHVNCILKSGMILEEDMSVLKTFWNPMFSCGIVASERRFLLTSATITTVGLATTVKRHSIYPFLIAILPSTVLLWPRSISYFRSRRYKRRFERLLCLMKSTYSLCKEIDQYYRKRDAAVKSQKLPLCAFKVLVKPGELFLRFAASSLHDIINQIQKDMVTICKWLPITEGDFFASIHRDLDYLFVASDFSFDEVRAQFHKLSDFFVLITSNFFTCLGLSCCMQLWMNQCHLPNILDHWLPLLVSHLDRLLNEMRAGLNRISFDVYVGVTDTKGSGIGRSRLERPITDLLHSLQNAFETARLLQMLDAEERTEECVTTLDNVKKQMDKSQEFFSILSAMILVTRQKSTSVKQPVEVAPPTDDHIEPDIEIVDGTRIPGSEPDDSPYLANEAEAPVR